MLTNQSVLAMKTTTKTFITSNYTESCQNQIAFIIYTHQNDIEVQHGKLISNVNIFQDLTKIKTKF